MKEIKFNLNEKPKTREEHVAYLVTIENVDLMRQYVNKYSTGASYVGSWVTWFDAVIGSKIKQYPRNKYYLYFSNGWTLGWDGINNGVAKRYHYEIYYVVPNSPMVME